MKSIRIWIIWGGFFAHQSLAIFKALDMQGYNIQLDIYDAYDMCATWEWSGWYSTVWSYIQEVWWYNQSEEDYFTSLFAGDLWWLILAIRKQTCYNAYLKTYKLAWKPTHKSIAKHMKWMRERLFNPAISFFPNHKVSKILSKGSIVEVVVNDLVRTYDYVICTWLSPYQNEQSSTIADIKDIRSKLEQRQWIEVVKNKKIALVWDGLSCWVIFTELCERFCDENEIFWFHKYPITKIDTSEEINQYFRFEKEVYTNWHTLSDEKKRSIHIKWNGWWVRESVFNYLSHKHVFLCPLEKQNPDTYDFYIYATGLNRLHLFDLFSSSSLKDSYLKNKKLFVQKMEESMAKRSSLTLPGYSNIYRPQMSKLLFAWFPVFRSGHICMEHIFKEMLADHFFQVSESFKIQKQVCSTHSVMNQEW